MKTFYTILIAVMLMTVLAGCGSPASAQSSGATPTPTASGATVPGNPTPTPGDAPAEGVTLNLTLEDNGKTIHMKQGERLLLKLGEAYTWDMTISDMAVLSRVKNVMVIRGAQGLYDAAQAGQSVITAHGDPTCLSEKPACAQPSILFTATVIVE